jgi:hypothetical protein
MVFSVECNECNVLAWVNRVPGNPFLFLAKTICRNPEIPYLVIYKSISPCIDSRVENQEATTTKYWQV